ncbi:deleted in malignant brain tumors 1 protein-like [Liolophura sinensis]|uniref:deleted in malignant brain tumors 1 protein-like n=1 Tax=Liolophura sinensis TaxID=3198878 RepID=UPI00315892CB
MSTICWFVGILTISTKFVNGYDITGRTCGDPALTPDAISAGNGGVCDTGAGIVHATKVLLPLKYHAEDTKHDMTRPGFDPLAPDSKPYALTIRPSKCLIDDACYENGEENPSVPSQICNSNTRTTEFTTVENYALRLVNGDQTADYLFGRLEVFNSGSWGTVCDDGFTDLTAVTLCGFLGYSLGYFATNAAFGEGTGTLWLDELVCAGTEANISQCSHLPWGMTDCQHDEDVGLICMHTPVETIPMRLENGEETAGSLSGRLEVLLLGSWGTVCGNSASQVTTVTLCGMFNYSHGEYVMDGRFGEGTGQIWLDEVICAGNETDISQCSYELLGHRDCSHSDDLGLVCSGPIGKCVVNNITYDDGDMDPNDDCKEYVCYDDGESQPGVPCMACVSETSTTEFTLLQNKCLIEDVCYDDGDSQPGVPCMQCVSETSTTEFTLLQNNCVVNNNCYGEGAEDPNDNCKQCISGSSTTSFTLNTQGRCSINGVCYEDGTVNPDNVCEHCDVSENSSQWIPTIYELTNGATIRCSAFCDFIRLYGKGMISVVCSYSGFITARNFGDMCYMRDVSSLDCPARGGTLTRYKVMCGHKTPVQASADPVVCP